MYVFSVCKDRFHLTRVSPRYDGSDDRAHSVRGHAVIQTVVSLKLHAMSMRPYTTVWMTARTVIRTVVSCFLTCASMGKSNYYDKMK